MLQDSSLRVVRKCYLSFKNKSNVKNIVICDCSADCNEQCNLFGSKVNGLIVNISC